jgi:hypothetical protein
MTTVAQLRNDPDSIAIEHGEQFFYLAHWRHPRDGAFAGLWSIVVSTRAKAASFFSRRANVLADSRLSDTAKKDDEKQLAIETLRALGSEQRDLNQAIASHDTERRRLAQVPAADSAQMLLDIELARYFRSLTEPEREALVGALVSGRESRFVDAVMRLPTRLFGLTEEMAGIIRAHAIERKAPAEVERLRELHAAAQTAQRVIAKSVEIITNSSALTLQERMAALGKDAWQIHIKDGAPDALEALARKYQVT